MLVPGQPLKNMVLAFCLGLQGVLLCSLCCVSGVQAETFGSVSTIFSSKLGEKKRGGGGRIIHLQIFLLYKCGLVQVIMMLTGADPVVCLSGGTKVFRLWIVDFKVLQPKGVSCLCKCF